MHNLAQERLKLKDAVPTILDYPLPLSLHTTTPIQTEYSDEGVKAGQKIAYYIYVCFFLIIGRTLQVNLREQFKIIKKAVQDPFKFRYWVELRDLQYGDIELGSNMCLISTYKQPIF